MKNKRNFIMNLVLTISFLAALAGGFYYFKKLNDFDKNPKISVVIPVYNTEAYIPECLDSIINQTYKNLEIICVNDGSKDNSLNLLKKYAEKDSRIKIIDQKNQGVSAARNNGIKAATGEYLNFMDSDDYIDTDAYKICMERINEDKLHGKDIDILVFDWIYFPVGNNDRGIPEKVYINDSFKAVIEGKVGNFSVNKIFKTSLIKDNDVWFMEDVRYCEDDLFICMILPHAKNITLMPKKFYYYRQKREGSASMQVNNEKELKNGVLRSRHLVDDWSKRSFGHWNWLVEKVRWVTYPRIVKLESDELKAMYSKQTMEIFDNTILKHVKEENLSDEIKNEFKIIRQYAEKADQ